MLNKYVITGFVLIIILLALFKETFTTELNWSIGLYRGETPFNISGDGVKNPIITADDITDVEARFVADPFIMRYKEKYYLFFEIFLKENKKGVIGVAVSDNGMDWKYSGVILEEPFHLSYPYVFKYNNNVYMIPESGQANAVFLYKANIDEFPSKWVRVKKIIDGYFEDSSILEYDGKFWLFGQTDKGKYDRLELWFSDNLEGEWKEHPKSPIINGDPNIARPGGRIIKYNNKIYRFSQDDYPSYGYQVWASEIITLTTTEYEEKLLKDPVIKAKDEWSHDIFGAWNELGMHQMDPMKMDGDGWVVAVDGLGEELIKRE